MKKNTSQKSLKICTETTQLIALAWLFIFVDSTLEELRERVRILEQEVSDNQEILPRRFRERTLLSSVNIFDEDRSRAVGVAFFIGSNRRAITASHILSTFYPLDKDKNSNTGKCIKGAMHRHQEDGTSLMEDVDFNILLRHERFDLAVLQLSHTYGDADAFLDIPDIHYDFQNSKSRMAVTSFSNFLSEHLPVQVQRDFCVIPAQYLKSSPHHIVYSSNLFSGDSGGAILLSHDGVVRAMHQETVNQAREELERGVFDEDEVVDSINSLISCLAAGLHWIAIGCARNSGIN